MVVAAEQKAVMHVDLMEELQEGQCQMNKKLPVQKQKIITLDAKNLFKASEALTEEKDKPFKVDMTDKFTSGMIVKQEAMMETCPLFDQLLMVLEDNGEDNAAAIICNGPGAAGLLRGVLLQSRQNKELL